MMKKKNLDIYIIVFILVGLLFIRTALPNQNFQTFSLMFLSVLFEALPFILIGSLISSLLTLYASQERIEKLVPKNKFLGILIMSFSGVIFPLCECSIVPISRGLIRKKLPISMAIAFMLSVPIVNPLVFFSTYVAFQSLEIALIRTGLGILSGFIIGCLIEIFIKDKRVLKNESSTEHISDLKGHDNFHSHSFECEHSDPNPTFVGILAHTSSEFFSMGKYLIIGSFISALIKISVPTDIILGLGQNMILSVIVMMLLAFLLSVCSEADAFIARGFSSNFRMGSIFSFILFGPMLDIKNLIMMFGAFKRKFVLKLITIVALYHLILGVVLNIIGV